MRISSACALVLAGLMSACTAPPAEVAGQPADGDTEEDSFLVAKADGGCVDSDSPAAEGILALVNDPSVRFDDLDAPTSRGGAGLHRTAAQGLVDGRPFANLREVDDVPYAGPHACRALARYACNEQDRCLQSVSVMTWNLRHFPLTPQTEDAVVEILEDLAPDFVAIQEVQDSAALARIAQRRPEFTVIEAEPGPFSGVAALVRESSLDVRRSEDRFENDWFAFPRPMLEVEVEITGSSSRLKLGVAHLKAMSDHRSMDRRREASTELRSWFDARRAEGSHAIVLGDLNDEVTDAPTENVFAPLLDDNAGVTFLTEDAEAQGAATYIPWSRMLDHVIITDGLEPFHIDTDVLALDENPDYERYISDHRPVLSLFEFPVQYEG